MSTPRKAGNLGPLPKADRNSELQELSIRAFQQILPVSKFLFRGKPADDFGVDGILELKIDSCATNLCAQVQLKCIEASNINKDRTISLSIDVSNVNYMLNGQSPLYVLYIVSRNEIRYLWARDERKRLDKKKPGWMDQDNISLHFEKVLTPAGVDKIHERIRQEAQLQRRIHDVLARATTAERVFINIDAETLQTIDSDDACQLLVISGASYVSAGYASVVIGLFDFISPTAARAPRLQMVRSYAYFTLGKYQAALAHAVEALLKSGELADDDQQFLLYLKDACDFHCGSIDLIEYTRRQDARSKEETGLFALMYRLDSVRHAYLQETHLDKRQQCYTDIRSIVANILELADTSPLARLQARLTLLHAEGAQAVSQLLNELSVYKTRVMMGFPADHQGYIQVLDKRFGRWEQDISEPIEEAKAIIHPIVIGDALNTRVAVRILKLSTLIAVGKISEGIPEEVILANMAEAEQAVDIHSVTESLEGELNARMLIADLFELDGQPQSSRTIAESVLPKALAMNYAGITAHAKSHISGDTLLNRAEERNISDPNRHCFCSKYKYESAIGVPDWKSVINAFKQTYCTGCAGREPKIS